VEIKSVDLVYGKDKDRGVPALLAVTAAMSAVSAGQAFSTYCSHEIQAG
jgi:hypothetical protein